MPNGPQAIHRLVSFLGTGSYNPTTYAFGEHGAAGTPFVCRALAELLQPAEIVVLATEQAESIHGSALKEALRTVGFPLRNFVRIPSGENRDQLWGQFDAIKEQLRHCPGPVMLDITHGFRSAPFFAAAIASFVRVVDKQPLELRICYAAFEARKEGVTQIWDLSDFVTLLDWTTALMLFFRTGRAELAAAEAERVGRGLSRRWAETKEGEPPNLAKLGRALRDFGANLETLRTGDLLLGAEGSAASLAAALREARASAAAVPPLADVLDRVHRDLVEPLLGAADHLADDAGHHALAGLARLYLDMGRWAEAAVVVREGWITRYATPAAAFGGRNQNRPSIDDNARHDAEDRWSEGVREIARRIGNIRNDIEHGGFRHQPLKAGDLQDQLKKLVDEFAALPSAAERSVAAGHEPVFVNLSNHPNESWSPAQREAALQLAPDIRDLPFPDVPPEAGLAEIAELADQVIAGFLAEFPGATHAMVQGEFTLAHTLVRRLQQMGILCLAATTRREVVENGRGGKTSRFEFVRLREYG
jgi:CRISPR-associated protein Csx16